MATKNTTTQTTINPFLAVLAQETEKLEKKQSAKITKQVTETVEQSKLLAEAACQSLKITLSDTATEFYGLMVASASTDGIAAASGAQLAESVVNMITAYYNGNKESLQPIVDASNMWITTKAKGECKTANLPNNLRLLVSRKSVEIATGDDEQNPLHDFKLTLSTEANEAKVKTVVIKEAPLKAKAKKSKAQKVFDTITKLDVLDADELISLIATDAALSAQFGTLASINDAKNEVATRESIAQLEARRNAAVTKEDDLQDTLDAATEKKCELVDLLDDKNDELAENEKLLTAKREEKLALEGKLKRARKEETKAQLADDLLIASEQLDDLLGDNEVITNEAHQLAIQLSAAQKSLNKADEAYNNQAHLVATLATNLEKSRAQLTH
ncbi:hypothetical protein SIPHO059v1_p0092 [Vibrio phage 264E42.1]|nr:hypothetical protein SIPHO059v1_p0092 [Vibrio phage 264E42.1]